MAIRKARLKFAASGGESSLLVWTPATEMVKEVGPESYFLLPIMHRQGGILAAIPSGFLSEELLVDASEEGYDGVVGPSKDFEAALMEEDETGQIIDSGYAKSFVVVDLSDAVLSSLKEYDQLEEVSVFPFEDTMPAALPKVVDALPTILDWIDAATLSRVNFYSAREEQAVPAAPKRNPPKKVSNAALVEQLTLLASQVQMIGEQQKVLSQALGPKVAPATADPAIAPLPGGTLVSRLPDVSNGLDLLQSTPKRAASLVGPPPKTKAPGTPLVKPTVLLEDEPKTIGETPAEGSIIGALATQPTAITALVADKWRRRHARSVFFKQSAPFPFFSRSWSSGEDAGRTCQPYLQLFPGNSTTVVSPDEPGKGCSKDTRGVGGGWCLYNRVPRTVRGIQKCKRCRAEFVGCRPRYGLCRSWRLCGYKRVPGASLCSIGAKCARRVVVVGLDSHSTRRFAGHALCRQDAASGGSWTSFCTTGAPYVGSNIVGLPSRNRGPHYSEDGSEDHKSSTCKSISRSSRGREDAFPPEATKVPQEAEGCPRSKGAMKHGSGFCMTAGGTQATFGGNVQDAATLHPPLPGGGRPTSMPSTTTPFQKSSTDGQLISCPKWCAMLVSNILKSRTPFASFLNKSIFLSQANQRIGLAPTFFPIPVPPGGHFNRMPAGLSQQKRRMFHLRRAIHTICMALNYWYGGGNFGDLEFLQREPNAQHRCLYGRLATLIRSEGLTQPFLVVKSGRRFPNLIARLGELSDILTKHGAVDPYTRAFAGFDGSLDDEAAGSLNPYRDLDPSRLALHGTGSWDATPFLSDNLVMAYREPRVLLAGLEAGIHPAVRDSQEKVVDLAMKWDSNNLLFVHDEPIHPDSFVRIFNCYKNISTDRQIGDRRGQNSLESRLVGPSRDLPSGADLQDLYADPKQDKLCLSVTDRRDFYHQLSCTRSRAVSNTIGPGVPWSMLVDTKGYANYMIRSSKEKKAARESRGDFLGSYAWPPTSKDYVGPEAGHLWISFQSVLQGDHSGVEICTDAHVNLLQSYGLLSDSSRMVASRPRLSESIADGLVIDDYYCVSREKATTPNSSSAAYGRYVKSQQAYKDHCLLGSPQKDILGDNEGKAIGAYVNSSERARSRGLITLAAPPEKRLSLSHLTLQVCSLTHTTDSLHLCLVGGWVSLLNYRRPMMSMMSKCFHLVDGATYDPNEPKVIQLPRSVADELTLLAVLALLALHEISAAYDPYIYATDASNTMGGICRARVGGDVAEILWRHCKSKGAYTRLLSRAEVLMRRLELHEEGRELPTPTSIPRPLAFSFDFVEVFAGSAKVTSYMARLGVPVGPAIELSLSEEFNVLNEWVLRWISHLVCQRLIKSFAIEPPCTTFSIMRRPRLRSRERPLGFNARDPTTANGNFTFSHVALGNFAIWQENIELWPCGRRLFHPT